MYRGGKARFGGGTVQRCRGIVRRSRGTVVRGEGKVQFCTVRGRHSEVLRCKGVASYRDGNVALRIAGARLGVVWLWQSTVQRGHRLVTQRHSCVLRRYHPLG